MKSSFSRAFFPTAIIVLAALLLVGASVHTLMRNTVTKQSMERLQNEASTISSLAAAYYTEGSMSAQDFFVNLSLATHISETDAVICDSRGKLVLCSDSPMGCRHQGMVIGQAYLQRVFETGMVFDTGSVEGLYEESRYVVGMPIVDKSTHKNVGLVVVSTPVSRALAFIESLGDIYGFVAVLVVVLAVISIIILARRQASPLQELAKAANDFGHGKLESRVTVYKNSPQEVQDLALAFNNMAERLQKSEYRRNEFVANVSHELKTPMTTISGYLDGMLDGTIPEERHTHYMQMVSGETKRLSRLVRSMLDISRMQGQEGIPAEKLQRFDICECAGQVLITFEQKITEKNLNVEVDLPEDPVYAWADPDAITQVIYNLVDNGVKFCHSGKTLSLSIREGDSKVFVSVANEGDTIPADELPLLFDRFHKLDKSRTENRDGWGLGLYIVKTLICRHGEDISVTSRDGRTEFTFTLPLVG